MSILIYYGEVEILVYQKQYFVPYNITLIFMQTVNLFNGGSIPSLATKNPMRNQTYPSDIGEG